MDAKEAEKIAAAAAASMAADKPIEEEHIVTGLTLSQAVTDEESKQAILQPYVEKLRLILSKHTRLHNTQKMAEILRHLYLGDFTDANNVTALKSKGITHVINCAAGDLRSNENLYRKHDIKLLAFNGKDSADYNIFQHFEDAYNFIQEARAMRGKCFVHCAMGINRSGALVTAYCMVFNQIGPISAARNVKDKRAQLITNPAFQRQLIDLAWERGLLHKDINETCKITDQE